MDRYRVLVTGSRDWAPVTLIESILTRLKARHGSALIVAHGACPTGIDVTFRRACETMGIGEQRYPAAWETQGKAAGPIRNTAMVQAGADVCLAFSRKLTESRGTSDCVRKAISAGIPVWLVDRDDGPETKPKRLEKIHE
jgi:hypothetical protein